MIALRAGEIQQEPNLRRRPNTCSQRRCSTSLLKSLATSIVVIESTSLVRTIALSCICLLRSGSAKWKWVPGFAWQNNSYSTSTCTSACSCCEQASRRRRKRASLLLPSGSMRAMNNSRPRSLLSPSRACSCCAFATALSRSSSLHCSCTACARSSSVASSKSVSLALGFVSVKIFAASTRRLSALSTLAAFTKAPRCI